MTYCHRCPQRHRATERGSHWPGAPQSGGGRPGSKPDRLAADATHSRLLSLVPSCATQRKGKGCREVPNNSDPHAAPALSPKHRGGTRIPVNFQSPKPSVSPESTAMPLPALLCQVYCQLIPVLVAARRSFYRPQMRSLRGNFS